VKPCDFILQDTMDRAFGLLLEMPSIHSDLYSNKICISIQNSVWIT